MAQQGKKRLDDQLLLLLACGATVEAAARSAGVSARTAYRRMEDPEFRRRLQKARDDMIERTSGVLTASSNEGVKALLTLVRDSHSDAVRLGAARAILEMCMKVRELTELEKRITALEEQLLIDKNGR